MPNDELRTIQIDTTEMDVPTAITWEDIYPVGAVYMSMSATSPATLFGGTWTKIEAKFLLATGTLPSGSGVGAGSTGGEEMVTLTEDNLPWVEGSFRIRKYLTSPASGNVGAVVWNARDAVTINGNASATANGLTSSSDATGIGASDVTFSFGQDQAHNNMPLYIGVHVWYRTS